MNIVEFTDATATTATAKVTPEKTGSLRVTAAGKDGTAKITLLDSRKNALTGKTTVDTNSQKQAKRIVTYGVTAGETYYIKVDFGETYEESGYHYGVISAANNECTGKAGTAKTSSASLAKGKSISAVLPAKGSSWFKVTTTAKQSIFMLTAETDGKVQFTVYHKTGKKTQKKVMTISRTGLIRFIGTSAKKTKQTFWIKVTPVKDADGYSASGVYSVSRVK